MLEIAFRVQFDVNIRLPLKIFAKSRQNERNQKPSHMLSNAAGGNMPSDPLIRSGGIEIVRTANPTKPHKFISSANRIWLIPKQIMVDESVGNTNAAQQTLIHFSIHFSVGFVLYEISLYAVLYVIWNDSFLLNESRKVHFIYSINSRRMN